MTSPAQDFNPLPDRAATLSIGARLKARREQLGLTIEQAAQQLKLAKSQVSAIERDAFDSLPGNTFARGFVRNYARLLEMDPAPILEDLSVWLPSERVQTALPKVHEDETFALGNGASRTIQLWLVILVGLIVGAGSVFWYLQQPASPQLDVRQAASTVAAVTQIVAVAGVASEAAVVDGGRERVASAFEETASMASAAAMALPTAEIKGLEAKASDVKSVGAANASAVIGNGELRIVAEADSWVQVLDADGNKLVSEIIKQGESRAVGGVPPYRVKIGNAPQTHLYLRGRQVDLDSYTKTDVATLELK